MSSQIGTNRSQSAILVNATVQAVLISLLREIEDNATVDEMRDIIESLLHYAQGGRTQ